MDKDLHGFLVEWALNFIKNKDSFAKKIVSIEKEKDGFDIFVKFKDKEQFVSVIEKLNNFEAISGKIKPDNFFSIFTLNSKENLDYLSKNWKKFTEYRLLSIIFTNPFSNTDKKWMISPFVHNKICDPASLVLGLKSLFEMVEETNEEKCVSRIGSDK